MENMKFFKMMKDEGAFCPSKAHKEDAGYDLRSPIQFVLPAKGSYVVDTGVHILIDKNYAGIVCSKSGLYHKHGIITTGLVDAGYTGSIRVKLSNLSDDDFNVNIGDKIAQIYFLPIVNVDFIPTAKLPETERRNGGFGSSGR